MGDHDECGALFAVELDEEVEDDATVGGVEIAGGLVGEEDGGLGHEGAGEGDALLLTTTELDWVVGGAVEEADLIEELTCTGHAVAGGTSEFVGEENVFFRSESGDQLVALEYEADFGAADARHAVFVEVSDVYAVEQDAARAWGVEASKKAKQRALAAAGSAHDGDEFAMGNLKADPL